MFDFQSLYGKSKRKSQSKISESLPFWIKTILTKLSTWKSSSAEEEKPPDQSPLFPSSAAYSAELGMSEPMAH